MHVFTKAVRIQAVFNVAVWAVSLHKLNPVIPFLFVTSSGVDSVLANVYYLILHVFNKLILIKIFVANDLLFEFCSL